MSSLVFNGEPIAYEGFDLEVNEQGVYYEGEPIMDNGLFFICTPLYMFNGVIITYEEGGITYSN